MRTVAEIYTAYRIMPALQMHQLRVAAVGKLVCDNFAGGIDANAVVLACLFHDMGNIIKFDLSVFPEFREPEGIDYWQGIKDEWIAKYGTDEHGASNEIAKEIGLPESVRTLIDETRFSRLQAARDGASYEGKIVKYADMRVSPFGIVAMAERLEEGRKRYAEKKGYNTPEGREQYQISIEAASGIERQIFAQCSIKPEDINDRSAAQIIEELRNYPIE
jgi:5'-deoxynucleotidase YfbR-like HD superfamily hydrolase